MANRKRVARATRDKTLRVRVNDHDLSVIRSRAESVGLSSSEYVRVRCCDHRMPRVVHVVRDADAQRLASEVRRIGINFNQIARDVNVLRRGGVADPTRRADIGDALSQVARELVPLVAAAEELCEARTYTAKAAAHGDD